MDETETPTENRAPEVRINGVLYVPVSEANPNARAIEDALVESWWGEGWRGQQPQAINYLRVIVTDTAEADEGYSIAEFVAAVLAHIDQAPA